MLTPIQKPDEPLAPMLQADIEQHIADLKAEALRSLQVIQTGRHVAFAQYNMTDLSIILPDLSMWSDQSDYCLAGLYSMALHEIGHANDPQLRQPQPREYMWQAELFAWEWAIEHAIIWTVGSQTMLEISLGSYLLDWRAPDEFRDATYQLVARMRQQIGLLPIKRQGINLCANPKDILSRLQAGREWYEQAK